MDSIAKELLALSKDKTKLMKVPSKAKNRPKPIKCLVYWLEENLVSIVSKSAVDVPVGKSVEEGSIYMVRYSGKKYSAKVLKISDDVSLLKKEELAMAACLERATSQPELSEVVDISDEETGNVLSATESADDDQEPPAPAKKKHRGSTSKQKLEKQLSEITDKAEQLVADTGVTSNDGPLDQQDDIQVEAWEAQCYKCSLMEDDKAALVKEVTVLKKKIQGLEKEVEDLKEANEDLKKRGSQIPAPPEKTSCEKPRAGTTTPGLAEEFKMVELVTGSGVYIYPGQKTVIDSAGTPGQCLSYLVATFFTREELGRSNLTGKNGRDALDAEVLKAIIEYHVQHHKVSPQKTRRIIAQKCQDARPGISIGPKKTKLKKSAKFVVEEDEEDEDEEDEV